jgi:small GTP-binding protein
VKLGNKSVTLQCWDTAGQEQFNSLGFAFYRGSNACILVFDLADLKSFEQLTKWKKDFLDHANPTDPAKFPFVIVGNKTDLADRAVQAEAAKAWCQNNGGYSYFETCATKNEGVSAVFEKISELTSEMSNAKFQVIPLSIDAKVDALFKNMNA